MHKRRNIISRLKDIVLNVQAHTDILEDNDHTYEEKGIYAKMIKE